MLRMILCVVVKTNFKIIEGDAVFSFQNLHIPSLLFSQGWEEATDASVTFLLRTVLGKGSRDAAVAPELTMPTDTSKLKKHLDLLLNKIMKGGVQLAIDNSGSTNNTGGFCYLPLNNVYL